MKYKLKRFFRWITKTTRRKTALVLLVALIINQFYPFIPFINPTKVSANGLIEPVTLGTSLFVNRNPDFNVWFGDRLDQSKHKITFEVGGKEIELRLKGASSQELGASDEIDQLIAQLKKDIQKPYLTTVEKSDGLADAIDQKIGDKATIRYEILPDRGVKESIIIQAPNPNDQIPYKFQFSMKLSNGMQLKSKLENLNDTKLNATDSATTNSYYFTDSKNKYLANFEPLIMTDAAGAKSNDISLSITPQECLLSSCYTLTLTANSQWLNAPERVFPIDLDPTIVHDKNPDFSSGTENRTQVNSSSAVESQYKELQSDINTVGLWHFNEGSGTTAYDASGNNNTGTLTNGPVWNGPTDTQVGLGKSSLKFDGVNDYITYGGTVTPRSAISFSFWLNTSSTAEEMIFDNTNGNRNNEGYFAEINWPTANKLRFVGAKVTTENFAFVSNTSVNDGKWHHIALTWDGTTSTGGAKIYIDGVLDNTATSASATTNAPSYNFRIGATASGATIPFVGSLDEFKIDNIARTPEEIAASASRFPYSIHESPVIDFGATPNTLDSLNYTATGAQTGDGEKPYSRDGLVAQWNFNETSGTTAYNMAGSDSCGGTPSSCNGTLTNFASTSSQDQAAGTGWTANNRRWGAGGLMFDGSNDYVSVPSVSNWNFGTGDFSVEMWFKSSVPGTTVVEPFSFFGAGGNYLRISLNNTPDASNYYAVIVGVNGTWVNYGARGGLTNGQWQHLVVQRSNGIAYIYVNGVLVTSLSATAAIDATGGTGRIIGAYNTTPVNPFNGIIDVTRIYTRSLSASEILSNYQSGNIEFQTRTGATATPNDGTWEAWKTTSGTGDTQIAALDNVADIATPSASIWQGVPIATSAGVLKMEGDNSLRTKIGAPQVDQNTVGLWHLEETSGTGAYIQDATANNNDGTPTGTTVVDGFYGKGRSFNGTSNYIGAGASSTLSFQYTDAFSISAWFKATSASVPPVRMIAAKWASYASGKGYGLFLDGSGGVYMGYQTNGTNYKFAYSNVNTYDDGLWHHAVGVNTTGSAISLYVDGVLQTNSTSAGSITDITNATNFYIGADGTTPEYFFSGSIDEVVVKNSTMSAEEAAEAYRAGRDHRISKSLISSDLSNKTKLPFYVASDRPGTFLEATVGESAYANYEPDANTKLLLHLDEQSGSGAYLKDSSGRGNNGTPTNTSSVQGKIGRGRLFTEASTDIIEAATSTDWAFGTADFYVDAWYYPLASDASYALIVTSGVSGSGSWYIDSDDPGTGLVRFYSYNIGLSITGVAATNNIWNHVAITRTGNTWNLYQNGVLTATTTNSGDVGSTTKPLGLGCQSGNCGAADSINGYIDEVRILSGSGAAKTADEIRQAYEIGKRTHPITIDFKADLDSSNLIANTSDLSFAIQPDTDVTANSLNINKGEKIIVKENVSGTEYLAQGIVSAITYENGTSNPNANNQDINSLSLSQITINSWDSGSTVPSGGFTTAATVFKWQREYMDLTGVSFASQRDAVTRLSLRVIDGSQGANVWLDDFESADYSDGSRVAIGSTVNRYFQYRAILNASSSMLSPSLNNVTINYNSGTVAQAPKVKDASSDFSATGTSLNRVTDTGSSNSPSLELAYKELPKDINTVGLWHMNEGTGTAADSSGNSNTGTLTNGAAWNTAANSKLGASSVSLDGTNDYVTAADSASLSVTGAFTIEAWVKRTGGTGSQEMIVSKDGSTTNRSFKLSFETTNKLQFLVCQTINCSTYLQLEGNATNTDTTNWIHYAAVFDPSKYGAIYINGVLDAQATTTVTGVYDGTAAFEIGGRSSEGTGTVLTGSVDEVRISNIARTPEEIKYDAGRRPYGVYTSDVQNLGTKVSSIDNIRWTENGVQTGDGETPYSTNSLVAQWNFNETSGTTAAVTSTSSCGTSCNGTVTTMTTTSQDAAAGDGWTANNKRWGAGALMFDGTDGHVTMGDQSALDITGALSLSAWIKRTKTGVIHPIVTKGDFVSGANASGYYFAINASNFLEARIGPSGAEYVTIDTVALTDSDWHHVAWSYSPSTYSRIYIDGILRKERTDSVPASIPVTANSFTVGKRSAEANYFQGNIDAVQVYSRSLSATEILSLAQSTNVELQTRTGTTSTPNDGTWEEWRPSGTSTETQLNNQDGPYQYNTIDSGLLNYWPMDETTDNSCTGGTNDICDKKGSNDGAATGTKIVDGKFGKQRFFNGTSDLIQTTSNSLATADTFSLETWFNTTTTTSRQHILWEGASTNNGWGFGLCGSSSGLTQEMNLSITGQADNSVTQVDNILSFFMGYESCSQGINMSVAIAANTWYHAVVVVNNISTSPTSSLFLNGILVATDTGTTAGLSRSNWDTNLIIGSPSAASRYFSGTIDEVRTYTSALPANTIYNHYSEGITSLGLTSGLTTNTDTNTKVEGAGSQKITVGAPKIDGNTVALWHLDETSGSGAYIQDATANNNDGTPTGTTVVDGFYGKARSFNGSSDKITVTDSTSFDLGGNNFAIGFWANLNSAAARDTVMVQGTSTTDFSWAVYFESSGVLYFDTYDDTNVRHASINVTHGGTANIWQFWSIVRNGSTLYFYRDGAQIGTATFNWNVRSVAKDLVIGGPDWPGTGDYWLTGKLDEISLVNGVARSADEIAEAYRAGRDHRISKSLISSDLSNKTKLPFYVASDRPGTFLEATVGESAFANYETDVNTVLQWHLDEQTGTASTYIKDSSGRGFNSTAMSGTTFVQGKIGKGRNFNGSSDYINCSDASCGGTSGTDFASTDNMTLDGWVKVTSGTTTWMMASKMDNGGAGYRIGAISSDLNFYWYDNTANNAIITVSQNIADGNWHYLAGVRDYGARKIYLYLDGTLIGQATDNTGAVGAAQQFEVGTSLAARYMNGSIDEVRLSRTNRTADEIRQAYEVGKRTYQITNDFVTTPQAAYSSGTSVTINNPYGTTNLTDTLSIGDTMIFKENVGGTETISQSLVTSISNTSSTYGTVTLLAAPTFPSGGYTTAATVFKWQREFVDLTGSLASQRDAVTRLSLRVIDGSQGANIWIDDIKAAGPYLTQSNTRTASVTSTPRQFMQYRIIFSTTDPLVSPTVTSVSVQTHANPVKVIGSDTLGADGSFDKDGNLHLGSNNVKKVAFYDRTKDQISYALDFDGSNDVVAATDNSNWTFGSSDFTVELWVNLASTAGVSTFASHYYQTSDRGWYFQYTGGNLGFGYSTNGTSETTKNVSWTPSIGIWYHLAATRNGNNLMMYVDGTQQGATQDVTGITIYDSANELGIGSLEGTGPAWTNSTNGRIDEVAIFNTARTASQISTDYNARRLSDTTTGLVGLWHFDEGAGTRAYDSSGNNNHGTLTNMTTTAWVNSQNDRDQSALSVQTLGVDPNWANGISRESYGLDFASAYLTSASTVTVDDFTFEAWVNPDSRSADGRIISIANAGFLPLLRIEGVSQQYECYAKDGGNAKSAAVATLNEWTHLACTYDNSTVKLYVNGKLEGSGSYTNSSAATDNVTVGANEGGSTQYFDGRIDEVAIFNTARTATEISADYYNRRFKGNETGLQLLWHMDEGANNLCSGGTNDVCDSTTNGNDGAASGGPTWMTDARAIMDNNARYISLNSQSSNPNDKGLEIYAISTTQFKYRWTGDQTWSSAVNFSSYPFATPAQLGTTGVYVGFDTTNGVFGDESYFLIPSWAIQQFSSTRGIRRSFPERSYLVATDRSVDIIDADDNTLWMRTSNGTSTGLLLNTLTNNVPSSITMSQGQLLVSTNGTAGTGVYRLDFNRDVAYRYNATNRTTGNNNLAKRNATDWSWGSADTGQNLIDSIVNDVSLLTSNGRLVMATANNTGLTKIANIMSNDTSYDYSDVTSNAYNRVKLAENYVSGTGAVGDMYALNSTNNALERWNNVVADSASETNGTPDATVNATSTPALFASAQTVNDLDVKTGTSLANSGNNTVFVAHNGGTTTFQEHRATLASSSVKYYTKDYIGEEMVGTTKAMWPFSGTSPNNDISLNATNLTKTGSSALVTGVRGTAASFDGSTYYTNTSGNTSLSGSSTGSIGLWFKWPNGNTTHNALIRSNTIVSNWGGYELEMNLRTTNKLSFGPQSATAYLCAGNIDVTTNASLNDGQWHHFVGVVDGSNCKVYVDGALDNSAAQSGSIAYNAGVNTNIQLGRYDTTNVPNGTVIDEPFVTSIALSATQIQQMYVAGKEALNNKYRVKLASDTVNQLAGTINVVKGVAASDQYIFAGTNTTGADDGILSRVLLRGDVTDRTYDESTTDPLIVDNDINSVAVSKDGAYIVVGTDDQGITIIHNGSAANRIRSGGKVQGPSKRPSN